MREMASKCSSYERRMAPALPAVAAIHMSSSGAASSPPKIGEDVGVVLAHLALDRQDFDCRVADEGAERPVVAIPKAAHLEAGA
jgi:hypothetical protein